MTIQKVDGSTLYDSLELSFNSVDKTSILKIHNVDSLASLTLKALASNAYTKQEIYTNSSIYANALNNKADKTKTNSYLKTEIYNRFTTLSNSSSADLGNIYRLVKSIDNNTFSIERFSLTSVSNSNAWLSLFSSVYDVDTMHCNLYVDKTDIFVKLNES